MLKGTVYHSRKRYISTYNRIYHFVFVSHILYKINCNVEIPNTGNRNLISKFYDEYDRARVS